jgi:hypothetical protein
MNSKEFLMQEEVAAYRDMQGNPLGPVRVWNLHEDIPGLTMSRSFGD